MKETTNIFWCKSCLNMSTRNRIEFNDEGVCNACVWSEEKKTLDWKRRENELIQLLDKHRKKSGDFDCIVPISGGKDGSYVSYNVKHKYGMNPLCVTITPPLPFKIGEENLKSFIASGYDLMQVNVNYEVMRLLNKRGFIEQGRPLYGWTTSIFSAVMRLAKKFAINLIMYGEDGEIEYGGSNESKYKPIFNPEFVKRVYLEQNTQNNLRDLSESEKYWWNFDDLGDLSEIECTHWSYFENWDSYRNYLVAKEHCGLKEKKDTNTGTYTNFAQNDNYLYDLHTRLMYLKFGFGRANQDAGIDIRRGAMDRQQAIALVEMYDCTTPESYIELYLDYYQMSREEYNKVVDSHVNKELFDKIDGVWMPNFKIV